MVFYAIIITASCIPGGRMYSNHRGKGQNFLCFQEAVMQAVHVLNTVTVPMGLQCPGLIVISPENTQDECWWFFLCNSHVFFSHSLLLVGWLGRPITVLQQAWDILSAVCAFTAHPSFELRWKRPNFQPFETYFFPSWLWWVKHLCCPTCGGL